MYSCISLCVNICVCMFVCVGECISVNRRPLNVTTMVENEIVGAHIYVYEDPRLHNNEYVIIRIMYIETVWLLVGYHFLFVHHCTNSTSTFI